jgi:hypothetical protein
MALLALPVRAWAGASDVPCEKPFVFSNAAVNVVVLPYSLPPSLGGKFIPAEPGRPRPMTVGEQLGALVQLETILSIAKYGSIGVVHLVGDTTRECTPETVLDKLTGKIGGTQQNERLKPGNALVMIWGRIFQTGPDLYLQSYVRFLRMGADETIDLPVRNQTLKGALSSQAFACAPRKIAVKDIADIQRQFTSARLLHSQPSETSPTIQLQEGATFSYWITDIKGDWVQVLPVNRTFGSSQKLPPGWLQARATDAQWSLRRQMPELYFVEGLTGYLTARVRSTAPAVVSSALQNAETGITRYLDAWGANAVLGSDAVAGGTPLAVAVPRQLRGFVSLMRGSETALADARAQFDRAATLAPHSANARNLATIAAVAQTYRQPSADQAPQKFVEQLRTMLGTDPDNTRILTNLGAVYDLVLTPATNAPASWTLSAPERGKFEQERAGLKALIKSSS